MTMTSQHERPSSSSSPSSSSVPHIFRGCSSISKYEMLEKLGEGTFGYSPHHKPINDSEVWKARRHNSKELFALKKILMHNEKEGVLFFLFTS
jgi:serine/threonine-protein kinase BUR1